jgi:hypothetical protein
LAQKGEVFAAVSAGSTVSPEMQLASLIRERIGLDSINLEHLVNFINLPEQDWNKAVLEQRSNDNEGDRFVRDFLNHE